MRTRAGHHRPEGSANLSLASLTTTRRRASLRTLWNGSLSVRMRQQEPNCQPCASPDSHDTLMQLLPIGMFFVIDSCFNGAQVLYAKCPRPPCCALLTALRHLPMCTHPRACVAAVLATHMFWPLCC